MQQPPEQSKTVAELWQNLYQSIVPEDIFIQGVNGKSKFTYKEVNAQAQCLAAYFISKKLQPGAIVILTGQENVVHTAYQIAAWLARLNVLCLPPFFRYDDLGVLIDNVQAKMILSSDYDSYAEGKAQLDGLADYIEIICLADRKQELKETDRITLYNNAVENGKIFWRENADLIKNRKESNSANDTALTFLDYPQNAAIVYKHNQVMQTLQAISQFIPTQQPDLKYLSLLPLSEPISQLMQLVCLSKKRLIMIPESNSNLAELLKKSKLVPITATPDFLEKLIQKLKVDNHKKNFEATIDTAVKYHTLVDQKQKIPFGLKIKFKIAEKFTLKPFRKKYFKGMEFVIVQEEQLTQNLKNYFIALRLPLLTIKGWGQSSGEQIALTFGAKQTSVNCGKPQLIKLVQPVHSKG